MIRCIQVGKKTYSEGITLRHFVIEDIINDVAISPDGKLIATASEDCTVKLLDWETRELVKIDQLHRGKKQIDITDELRKIRINNIGCIHARLHHADHCFN